MSDIRRLLEKMDSMSSAEKKPTGPKFPGYWKGTDPASKAKTKMVGSAEESVIKDLHTTAKKKVAEWQLEEDWKQFKEQDQADTSWLDKTLNKLAGQELPKSDVKPAAEPAKPAAPAKPVTAPAATTTPATVTPQATTDLSKQIKDVATASGIKNPDLIYPGQKIKLPSGQDYTVAKGDTLSGILTGKGKGWEGPGAGRGATGGPTADELAAAGAATITKSTPTVTPAKAEPAAPAAAASPAKPAYTGIDPVVRKRLGMAPATQAEIDAYNKANPPTVKTGSGGELKTGTGAAVQSGGAADVAKSATSAADNEVAKVNRAISGAESGANPNISFGDRIDPKTGQIVNRKGLITPEEFAGKKLSDMTIGEVQAFQAARDAQSKGAGAVGQYQFMPSTLANYAKKLGLSSDTKFDAATQQALQNALLADNRKTLERSGIQPNAANMYMAHYIGAGGAQAVHQAKSLTPNASVADVLVAQRLAKNPQLDPEAVKASLTKHNPELARIPVKDFEQVLAGKLDKGAKAKVSESIDSFVEDFKNFINGDTKPAGKAFGKMLRRINKDEKVTEFQNRQSPDAQITSPPAPDATKSSQFTADMDVVGDDGEEATMEANGNAQDPSQQATSPASPVKQAVSQQQAAQKKAQDERQDLQTALGTVSSIKPYLGPKTDVNQAASAITKISNNQPLTKPEAEAVSGLTPLVMKAAETPTSAAALKTALTTAGVMAKQGK